MIFYIMLLLCILIKRSFFNHWSLIIFLINLLINTRESILKIGFCFKFLCKHEWFVLLLAILCFKLAVCCLFVYWFFYYFFRLRWDTFDTVRTSSLSNILNQLTAYLCCLFFNRLMLLLRLRLDITLFVCISYLSLLLL